MIKVDNKCIINDKLYTFMTQVSFSRGLTQISFCFLFSFSFFKNFDFLVLGTSCLKAWCMLLPSKGFEYIYFFGFVNTDGLPLIKSLGICISMSSSESTSCWTLGSKVSLMFCYQMLQSNDLKRLNLSPVRCARSTKN